MDALLIIDMQVACIEQVPRHNIEHTIKTINALSNAFRQRSLPVIHIQHEEESGAFLRGSEGWFISSKMEVSESDNIVSKSYCDAFIKTGLKSVLENNAVTRVVVVGCATDFCVDSTIKGAIGNGYDVLVPQDGHTTGDRPHIEAQKLIEHFNWNWANLIVGTQSLDVMPSLEIMDFIE